MAIAFDNAASVTGTGVTSLTTASWTVAGSNRYMAASAVWTSNPAAVSEMRWGGSSGELLTEVSASPINYDGFMYSALFGKAGIAASNTTLYCLLAAAADEFAIGAASYTGVDQSTPLGTAVNATSGGGSATATLNVSSATNELVVAVISAFDHGAGITNLTDGAGQTARWQQNQIGGFPAGLQTEEAGAGTVTITATVSGSGDWSWGVIGVPLKPVSAGTDIQAKRIYVLQ